MRSRANSRRKMIIYHVNYREKISIKIILISGSMERYYENQTLLVNNLLYSINKQKRVLFIRSSSVSYSCFFAHTI